MTTSGEGDVAQPAPHTPYTEFSESTPVAVGAAVWALLFVLGLFLRPDLVDSGRGWWIWSTVAGVVLGGVGYVYLRRRQARLLRRSS